MNKKLAIKGHPTRGNEVIELLVMMGGVNRWKASGNIEKAYYSISNGVILYGPQIEKDTIIYTLEKFLEKYPFKVGDKVVVRNGELLTIKSMAWSEDCETMVYDFKDSVIVLAAEDLKLVDDNHTEPSKMKNVLTELIEHIKSTPKEELEREFEEIKKWSNVGPTVEEFMTFCESVNKKPMYPTTLKECQTILNCKELL